MVLYTASAVISIPPTCGGVVKTMPATEPTNIALALASPSSSCTMSTSSLLVPSPIMGGSRVGLAQAPGAEPATAGEPKSVRPKCFRTFGDVESSWKIS